MARTTVLTTAERIRRHLSPGHNQEVAVTNTAMDTSQTTIDFLASSLPRSIQPGIILGVDQELLRVISIDSANVRANVIRGYLDSNAAGHAVNAQIDIAPRFSMLDIVDAMQSEIQSWGQQLYYVLGDTLTVSTVASGVELPVEWANTLGVVRCNQSESSAITGNTTWPELAVRMIRGTSASFDGAPTSGILLRFLEPIRTGSIFVVVAMPFNASGMTVSQDLTTDLHIPESMLDVLELGTKLRLIMNSDNARSSRQPQDEARRAEESPLGTMVSLEQLSIARYERRKAQEVRLLRRNYPIRIV